MGRVAHNGGWFANEEKSELWIRNDLNPKSMMMICYEIDYNILCEVNSNMCLFLYVFMIVYDSAGTLPKHCNNG